MFSTWLDSKPDETRNWGPWNPESRIELWPSYNLSPLPASTWVPTASSLPMLGLVAGEMAKPAKLQLRWTSSPLPASPVFHHLFLILVHGTFTYFYRTTFQIRHQERFKIIHHELYPSISFRNRESNLNSSFLMWPVRFSICIPKSITSMYHEVLNIRHAYFILYLRIRDHGRSGGRGRSVWARIIRIMLFTPQTIQRSLDLFINPLFIFQFGGYFIRDIIILPFPQIFRQFRESQR